MKTRSIDDIGSELLDLPSDERAHLVELLISSLRDDEEIERAWMEEAERRYENIRAGKAELIDNDEVFARMRARFG